MQSSGRTPSSILRKRAADEQNARRRSMRAKGGRRVSFAPDDELETMHLFSKDKNSPLAASASAHQQETQPLSELAQNQMYPLPPHQQQQVYAAPWPPLGADKHLAAAEPAPSGAALQLPPFDPHAQHGTDPYAMQSPLLSPMSMELTNDTLQAGGGGAGAMLPFAVGDNDSSLTLTGGICGAGANITDSVPGLSTLVEEDEDDMFAAGVAGSDCEGLAMELTGTAAAAAPEAAPPSPLTSPRSRPTTRRSAAASPSPAITARTSSRRASRDGSRGGSAAPSPLPAEAPPSSPRTRGRRSSTGAGTHDGPREPCGAESPPAGRRTAAPSLEPTPSPLRRITRSMTSPAAAGPAPGPFDASPLSLGGAGGGRRVTMARLADQQDKWGFVPGEEDTLMLDMNLPGAGGLGDATLHHVYSEGAGTGELTLAMRQGELLAPVQGAGARAGRRRSSVAQFASRQSLLGEVIPEEASTPQQQGGSAGGGAAELTPGRTPALLGAAGGGALRCEQETPADGAAADADGLTTNLLLDDRGGAGGGWGHVPLARASVGTTGRGSVGSNVPTMHLRYGHTTQLLADSTADGNTGRDGAGPFPRSAALAAFAATAAPAPCELATTEPPMAAAGGGPGGGTAAAAPGEECTTRLLADSTAASACNAGGFGALMRGGLFGTIAGGAPVVEPLLPGGPPASPPPQLQERLLEAHGAAAGLASPELGAAAPGAAAARATTAPPSTARPAGGGGRTRSASRSPAPAPSPVPAVADDSPLAAWQQQQQQHPAAPSPMLAAAAADGSEPTLELAAAASGGGGGGALEDATLEDFAPPPDLSGGGERPITMPFSGALQGTPAGPAALRTPSGRATAPPALPPSLSFTDFCQVADLQFLTHIRRGTSIGVMDFAPSVAPADLAGALQLLAVTGCEVAVLEGAMHELQQEMHSKRREAFELEERLGADNPPVFAAVQTARHTQLEQAKHCLVLLKKCCRSATACSWKQLRGRMERQLAERLAQQQADLEEQLSFVQGKLQQAQRQRDYAKSFHADVLRQLAAEEAAAQEAAAARSRLSSLRARLGELRSLNEDRRARAVEVQAQVEALRARCAEADAEAGALLARREQLSAALAVTPKPAQSRQAGLKLAAAERSVELATRLQGWQPLLAPDGAAWLASFGGRAAVRAALPAGPAPCFAEGRLEVAEAAAGGMGPGVGRRLLEALVGAMQARFSFRVPAALLPAAFVRAELALGRAVELAEACSEVFTQQPLLTAVDVVPAEGDGGGGEGWLRLALVEAERQLKVQVLLGLGALLGGGGGGAIPAHVEVVVAPEQAAGAAVRERLEAALAAALAGAGRGAAPGALLQGVCACATRCLLAAPATAAAPRAA